MKVSEDILVLPGKDQPEVWRAQSSGQAARQDPGKAKAAGWMALPMRSVISLPMRFPAMTAERRDAAVQLELESAGIAASESDFQIVGIDNASQQEQRAWTVVQSTTLPGDVNQAPLDAHFAPSVSFRPLKRGEAQLWEEGGHLTLAIPDENGKVLHAQALTSTEPDDDAAAELRCILAALELAGVAPELNAVTLERAEAPVDEELSPFAAGVELPVTVQPPVTPRLPQGSWRLTPPAIVHKRQQRRQQQTLMLAGAGFMLVLLALLGAYAGRLWSREHALQNELARINALEPELEVIKQAQDQWRILESAVVPDKYVMEVFHQVASLLPPEGIRLQGFEMRDGHIIIQGEASNQGLANGLREDLQRVPAFSGLSWDFPNSITGPDGRLPFRAEGSPAVAEETTPL